MIYFDRNYLLPFKALLAERSASGSIGKKVPDCHETSNHFAEYLSFFREIEEQVAKKVSEIKLSSNLEGVRVVLENHKGTAQIYLKGIQLQGAVVEYCVRLGQFEIDVTLLHLGQPAHKLENLSMRIGTFGSVFKCERNGVEWVMKRINFLRNNKRLRNVKQLPKPETLEWVVLEYAFCKVCSALGIGPKIRMQNYFDIVCFDDCLQFSMELCQPVTDWYYLLDQPQRRLKYCVRLLHELGFVHKDIKPSNAMYSPSCGLVLIDFGVSCAVKERPGVKSTTFREGTMRYMSEEMRELEFGMEGNVDLFWNDANALRLTLQRIEEGRVAAVGQDWRNDFTFEVGEDRTLKQLYSQYTNIKESEDKSVRLPKGTDRFPNCDYHNKTGVIEKRGIEFLLRTFGDCEELLHYFWKSQGSIIPRKSPQYQYLMPQKPQLQGIIKMHQTEIEFLKKLQIYPFPNRCVNLLLLECADISMRTGQIFTALNYLKKAQQHRFPNDWKVYQCLIDSIEGRPVCQSIFWKQMPENLIVQVALIQYSLKHYAQASSTFGFLVDAESAVQTSVISPRSLANTKKKICVKSACQLLQRTNPANRQLWVALARFSFGELCRFGYYQTMIERIQALQQQNTLTSNQRITLLLFFGLALLHSQQHSKAIQILEQALQISEVSERNEIEALLAIAHEDGGDLRNAIFHYRCLLDQVSNLSSPFVSVVKQRYAGCLLKTNEDQAEARRLIYEGQAALLIKSTHFPNTLLNVLNSYLHSVHEFLSDNYSYQQQCGLVELIQPHLFIFLDISEDEQFEVARLKADCVHLLAIACLKVRGETTSCYLLRRLLPSLLQYFQKVSTDRVQLLFSDSCQTDLTGSTLVNTAISEFLAQPSQPNNAFAQFLTQCDPFAGAYLLVTSLLWFTFSKKYREFEFLVDDAQLSRQISWIRQCVSTNGINRFLIKYIQLQTNQLPLSLKLCSQISGEPSDLYDKGCVLFQMGYYKDCVSILRRCIEMNNKSNFKNLNNRESAHLMHLLGDSLKSLGEPADECYQQAVIRYQLARQHKIMGIGWCYMCIGNLQAAEKMILKSTLPTGAQEINWKSKLVKMLKQIGLHHLKRNQYRRSKAYLMAAMLLCPPQEVLATRLQLLEVAYLLRDKRLFRRQAVKLLSNDVSCLYQEKLKNFLIQRKENIALKCLLEMPTHTNSKHKSLCVIGKGNIRRPDEKSRLYHGGLSCSFLKC